MKISARTRQILKNFALVNQNILITEGSKIRTLSAGKTVYAEADVEETFPVNFGIYDLNEFLGVLGLFSDPDFDFDENHVTIAQGKNSVTYLPADSSVLIFPKKSLQLKESAVEFDLESESFGSIIKAAGVLKAPFITFIGKNDKIEVIVHDKTNPNTNRYSVDAGETDQNFEIHIKTEFLSKLLAEKFKVAIYPDKKVVFNGDGKLYMIAAESDSSI